MAAFLFTPWPREVVALAAAGVLLARREMASREMLGLVDWHLLVLFAGLFVVNARGRSSPGCWAACSWRSRTRRRSTSRIPAALFGGDDRALEHRLERARR